MHEYAFSSLQVCMQTCDATSDDDDLYRAEVVADFAPLIYFCVAGASKLMNKMQSVFVKQ